jgi:hypothetical protein
MPGNNPKESIRHSKQGESLKSRKMILENALGLKYKERNVSYDGQHDCWDGDDEKVSQLANLRNG